MNVSGEEVISVIVAVYNAEKYVHKCIESLLSQTYRALEIILVNDGSTDDSGHICDAYAEKDDRVRVLHKENGGQASARNMALRIATGDYIGFVDADDWVAPDMYEVLYTALGETGAGIAMCGRYRVDEETGLGVKVFCHDGRRVVSSEEAVRRFLLWDDIDSSSCDKLFRKAVLAGLFFPSGYICEDVPFVYTALKQAGTIAMTGVPLYYYRQTPGSTSRSSYSERSMGLVLYSREVRDDVLSRYTGLKEEAEYYYLKCLSFFLELYYMAEKRGKCPVAYTLKDFRNRYMDARTKGKIWLMKMHLFAPVKKLIKRRRSL